MIIFVLKKLITFSDRYFLKRRIEKSLRNTDFVLQRLDILPSGVVTPGIVNIWPMNDGFDHRRSGKRCPCNPTAEPKMDEDGKIYFLVKHHDTMDC